MKNLFLFFLVFSVLSTLHSCKKIEEKRNPKVSGRVLDYHTRQPLANAKVFIGVIRDADYYAALDSVTTDENGYYEITSEPKFGKDYDFENDNFIVSAKKQGYEITFANKSFDGFDEFYINVRGSVNTEYKNLYLRKEITLNVELIDEMPYEERTSEKFVDFYLYSIDSKGEKLGYVSYPPYHKHLNPNNSWDGGKIDTHYFKQVVVPYSAYSINIRSCILANINENCIDLKEFLYFPISISNNVTIKY